MNAKKTVNSKKKTEQRRDQITEHQHRVHDHWRCGCLYKVNMSLVDINNRKLYKRVKITKSNRRRSHGFRPSTHQLVQHHKKAGTLSIYIPHAAGHATKSKAINTLL